ncbi:hypothetical protein MHU86_17858 [Fragilaria crotonensis]|nr:hypothetical protein MHU86_17858 [Fragilaria crotonensis]
MEMQMLKTKIRGLGTDGGDPNSLELAVLKVEGLPEGASPTFALQLSSPIEEASITKLFDTLDPTAEGSFAKFQGVETSNAILSVSAKDADIPLGASASIDIATLCSISDPMQSVYVTEKSVAIYAEGGDDVELTVAVCTVTFNVTYKPSAKDQREELYELLNKASEKKSKYVSELQQAAKQSHRVDPASTAAVKSGFLNKDAAPKKKEPSKLMQFYEKNLGPRSLVRQILPIAKNYLIFFGAVILFHFKGQELALPPPV